MWEDKSAKNDGAGIGLFSSHEDEPIDLSRVLGQPSDLGEDEFDEMSSYHEADKMSELQHSQDFEDSDSVGVLVEQVDVATNTSDFNVEARAAPYDNKP